MADGPPIGEKILMTPSSWAVSPKVFRVSYVEVIEEHEGYCSDLPQTGDKIHEERVAYMEDVTNVDVIHRKKVGHMCRGRGRYMGQTEVFKIKEIDPSKRKYKRKKIALPPKRGINPLENVSASDRPYPC